MENRVKILSVNIDNITFIEAIKTINNYIQQNKKKRLVVTPNSEMLVRAWNDSEFSQILNNADLKVPDGAGLLLASRILNSPLKERIGGIDLMQELLSLAAANGYSVYLLGGKPGIIEKAKSNIRKKYNGIDICGYHHGYLNESSRESVIKEINKVKPDILFVGMGVPLQEKFLSANLENLNIKIAMTVGGSYDVLSGKKKRAPLWMQRAYLEWFYRLMQEPLRIARVMAIPRFLFLILLNSIFGVEK